MTECDIFASRVVIKKLQNLSSRPVLEKALTQWASCYAIRYKSRSACRVGEPHFMLDGARRFVVGL